MEEKPNNADTATAETATEQPENSQDNVSQEQILAVMAQLEEKDKQLEEMTKRYKYLQADFENFRRRSRTEKEELAQVITESVVLKLLPIVDNFERALAVDKNQSAAAVLEGVSLIYRQFVNTLEKMDVRPIEAVGAVFDPNLHEAVATAVDEASQDGVILEEFQRGYTLGAKTIRPSMVKVATNSK